MKSDEIVVYPNGLRIKKNYFPIVVDPAKPMKLSNCKQKNDRVSNNDMSLSIK